MKFYEKIRALREEKGKTQYAVHKELGIGIETVRKYEKSNPETFPNSAQLILLKNYYDVSYEYLLDENCLNKHPETIAIGKKLKLSDESIEQIINLQSHKSFTGEVSIDKESPIYFDKWFSNFDDLSTFTLYLADYYILNDLLKCCQYFSSLLELSPYIIKCLNNNKKDLEPLFDLLNLNEKIYKNCVIHGDTTTQLNNDSYEELHSYISELKKYCNSYSSASNKNSLSKNGYDLDDDLFNILNEIVEIGCESFEFSYRDLQFCEFKLTELIRDSLHDISKSNIKFYLPNEYEKLLKTIKKGGEKK